MIKNKSIIELLLLTALQNPDGPDGLKIYQLLQALVGERLPILTQDTSETQPLFKWSKWNMYLKLTFLA